MRERCIEGGRERGRGTVVLRFVSDTQSLPVSVMLISLSRSLVTLASPWPFLPGCTTMTHCISKEMCAGKCTVCLCMYE